MSGMPIKFASFVLLSDVHKEYPALNGLHGPHTHGWDTLCGVLGDGGRVGVGL